MLRSCILVATAFCFTVSLASAASAQTSAPDIDRVLKDMGGEAIRHISTDICLPATAEEYEALGKNAVLMLRTSTAVATELPLKSVFAVHKGVRIPLHRIALLDKFDDAESSRTVQVSFYLLPVHLMKVDADVSADFAGARKDFGILHFSAKQGLDRGAPAFARLDEYDTPGDADPDAIARILVREYPDYFK